MNIKLNDIAKQALEVSKERERLGQLKSDTLSVLKHCAGEVCEAVDAYAEYCINGKEDFDEKQWEDKMLKDDFADELADIITCALTVAANENVDIEAALLRVQEKNSRMVSDD